jgi:hypothetical protein
MQSSVAMERNYRPEPTTPKHLRTGVNAASRRGGVVGMVYVLGKLGGVGR